MHSKDNTLDYLERVLSDNTQDLYKHLCKLDIDNNTSCVYNKIKAVVERSVILSALNSNAGNQSKAAKSLGISVLTLHNKIVKYDIGCIFT